jgi:hypothetical protein
MAWRVVVDDDDEEDEEEDIGGGFQEKKTGGVGGKLKEGGMCGAEGFLLGEMEEVH